MAELNAATQLLMNDVKIWEGYVDSYSTSHVTISSGSYSGTYYGSFVYNANGLVGGTVTSYKFSTSGVVDYTISGLKIPVATLDRYLNLDDGEGLQRYALSGNDTIKGSASNDVILAYNGNDYIDGKAGADKMYGGAGNDTYIVDNSGDKVYESLNAGIDVVQSKVTYTLSVNVENLQLTGTRAINATGNTFNNILTGNEFNNIIDGKAGLDRMIGAGGNDTYIVDHQSDVVVENAGGGDDTVQSSATYTLSANIETLILTGTAAINGTGNAQDNVLIGNAAANILTGNAGNDTLNGMAGDDRLIGGVGNDIYYVDSKNDIVVETANAGDDTVYSSVTYTLATNAENIFLTGTAALNATGNALVNKMTGNAANNILDGKAGADKMAGGLGNDTYIVDNIKDAITEALDAGTDTVKSSVSYVLGKNIENLTLTGDAVINADGNASANTITGNAQSNIIHGAGGDDTIIGAGGSDTLWGDAGADIFVFGLSALGSVDTVKDFSVAQGDKLNFKDMLVSYDPLENSISDFINISQSSAGATFKIDRDGSGSNYGWTKVVVLAGVSGLSSVDDLVNAGHIIV